MPDPQALISWLQVLFFLGGGVASLVGIKVGLKKLKAPEPPLTAIAGQVTVQQAERFVTKEDYERDQAELVKERERQARNRKEFYLKVEAMALAVAKVQADGGHLAIQVNNIDTKVDRILATMPRG